ncbi:MAG TPA: riboflavin synthase [Terriglobales bacterium]|nr:riboflavin synthase [Terriglobales bacterium]
MFTGIIDEVGRIESIRKAGGKTRITIAAERIPGELKQGDSVAVSGVCLTAVDITPKTFGADLAQETWERTSLSRLKTGALVNLELPMKADGRFGGHVVQGHVDGTGKFLGLEPIAGAQDYWLKIEIPPELEKYVVYKGSIAIEGISLTVARVDGREVRVAIIPHTAEVTNLKSLRPGDPVNLETDIIAKYVEKMMGGRSELKVEQLVEQGF